MLRHPLGRKNKNNFCTMFRRELGSLSKASSLTFSFSISCKIPLREDCTSLCRATLCSSGSFAVASCDRTATSSPARCSSLLRRDITLRRLCVYSIRLLVTASNQPSATAMISICSLSSLTPGRCFPICVISGPASILIRYESG